MNNDYQDNEVMEEADFYWCLQDLCQHMRHRGPLEVLRELLRVYDKVSIMEEHKPRTEASKGLAEHSPF